MKEEFSFEELTTLMTSTFRFPIGNILNMLSPIAATLNECEEYETLHYLNNIAIYCYSMTRITNMVSMYSNLINSKDAYETVSVDVRYLFEAILVPIKFMLSDNKYILNIKLPKIGTILQVNVKLITTAIYNIIVNSCEVSAYGSEININVSVVNNSVHIKISDFGDGLAASKLEHLFEPFYKTADLHDNEHLGLGLSLAKEIIEFHKGDIKIVSKPYLDEVNAKNMKPVTTVAITLPIGISNVAKLENAYDILDDTLKYSYFAKIAKLKFF